MAKLSVLILISFSLGIFSADKNEGFQSGIKQCITLPLRKDVPSPGPGLKQCSSWSQESCCKVNVSDEIALHGNKNFYNFHFDLCGDPSPECGKFLMDEECFYHCEPYLAEFLDPEHAKQGFVKGIPICARYCDAWFNACKNDLTCARNWLLDFDFSDEMENSCKANYTCKTFEELYTDGKDLCESMWGSAFIYETSENCMVMKFDKNCPINPNRCGHKNYTCTREDHDLCHIQNTSDACILQTNLIWVLLVAYIII